MITETFSRDDITDAYLGLPGYQIVCRRDGRDTAGGRGRGLLVYVKEGIPASELHLEGADQVTECCGITIPWGRGGGEVMKMVLVYRPPEIPEGPGSGETRRGSATYSGAWGGGWWWSEISISLVQIGTGAGQTVEGR
jgi:hypothetical protein